MKLINLFILSLLVSTAWGQTTTESPYSFYGLGDVNARAFANQRSMGGAQVAASSDVYINTLNPATFGSIMHTTFAVDINMDLRTIESATVSQKTNNTYFNNLAIAFPLGRRGGIAASLRQYTKIGYNIQVQGEDPFIGTYDFVYDGQGGINEFLFGAGYNIFQDSLTTISFGANFIYYFGFAETNRRTDNFDVTAGTLSSNIQNRTSVNDISFDLGLYLDRQISKDLKLGFGASYTPSLKMKAENSSLAYTYRPVSGSESVKDSSSFEDRNGEIVMPSALNIGLSLKIGSSWTFLADFKTQQWSELEILGEKQNLNNRTEFAFGVESQPNPDALAKYLQSMRYRVGFRLADTRLIVNNNYVSEYAITAGLGLPIMKTKSKSSINLGIEFGQRGESNGTLIKENFTNIFLGVSFNPHKFDTWFKKSKYN